MSASAGIADVHLHQVLSVVRDDTHENMHCAAGCVAQDIGEGFLNNPVHGSGDRRIGVG